MGTLAAPNGLEPTALVLIEDGATATQLERRFADRGATLEPGIAASILDDLADLGLVRVARGSGARRRFVTTSLGQQVVEGGGLAAPEVASRLAELERLRTDLLSTIAHELRTPLTAVRTCTGLLLDESASPNATQRRTLLETIGRNADRMQRLVGDILDLARFRSGSVSLQLRLFDAAALARSVIESIAPLAEQRGQRIELVDPAPEHPRVFGDHRRLEQALLNLVSNAQRFTPDGGRIELRVEIVEPFVRWSVADEGPGIPREDRARLFERFFVGRSDRHESGSGVGLGLPTALAIAQAHGGTIEVRSRRGSGSTFTLVVPAAGPSEAD